MSVYVEMLVPYDFDSLSCKEKAIKELETIKTRLASFTSQKNLSLTLRTMMERSLKARTDIDWICQFKIWI